MPETQLTSFPELPVYPRVGIIRSASRPVIDSTFSPIGQEYPFLQVSEIFLSQPAISA